METIYETIVGLEIHVQILTHSKAFSKDGNSFANQANANAGVITLAHPGTLPKMNIDHLHKAVLLGMAFGSNISKKHFFDRKHYFYPDLPKGYQISQFEEPIILGGYIAIEINGESKRIGITRAHMEEDAGKSTHPEGQDSSLVDLNRAGTPLLEIVSEPEIHSAAEARAFAKALYLQMKYADVSEADLYNGNMRFDVNVSVSKTDTLGTRTETKNLNSFKAVEKAVEYEIARQIEVLESGDEITQETRGWDDAKQRTFSQRTKEDAHDYRYMPEPDVPPIVITDEYIAEIQSAFPTMPGDLREKLQSAGLQTPQIETLIEEPILSQFAVTLVDEDAVKARTIINWLTGEITKLVIDSKATWKEVISAKAQLLQLATMVAENKLSSTGAKELLADAIAGKNPEEVAKEKNLLQVSDEGEIEKIVSEVLADNEKAANDVKSGEVKAISFLVGQVMAKSKGQANPGLAQQIIKKHLGL